MKEKSKVEEVVEEIPEEIRERYIAKKGEGRFTRPSTPEEIERVRKALAEEGIEYPPKK